MAKHDENKDVRLLSRIVKVNTVNKTIKAPKGTLIGIRSWGRIDYLTNYCGYVFIYDNTAKVNIFSNDTEISFKSSNKNKDRDLNYKMRRNSKRTQL